MLHTCYIYVTHIKISIYLSVYLSICLSIYLYVYIYIYAFRIYKYINIYIHPGGLKNYFNRQHMFPSKLRHHARGRTFNSFHIQPGDVQTDPPQKIQKLAMDIGSLTVGMIMPKNCCFASNGHMRNILS